MKKKLLLSLVFLMLFTLSNVFAHPGRTDANGGHHDYNNVSGLGPYHYHCGGYPAHLHPNGVCPYRSNQYKSTTRPPSNASYTPPKQTYTPPKQTYTPPRQTYTPPTKPINNSSTILPTSQQLPESKTTINIMVNGNKIYTNNFVVNGTTYVPLRAVSENLGASVNWDNNTRTASIYGKIQNISSADAIDYYFLENKYDLLTIASTNFYYTLLLKDTDLDQDINPSTESSRLLSYQMPQTILNEFTSSPNIDIRNYALKYNQYLLDLSRCAEKGLSSKSFEEYKIYLQEAIDIENKIMNDRDYLSEKLYEKLK